MGLFLFNVFVNDLVKDLDDKCDVDNFADDNTAGTSADTIDSLYRSLQRIAGVMLSWFDLNYMKANPDKFQFILFDKDNNSTLTLLSGVTLESLKVVKLLGVQIDFQLKFDEHVSVLCSKASRQINVLARLSKTLDQIGKLKIMQSCILCYFNYCPVVWHYCSKDSILKMQKNTI